MTYLKQVKTFEIPWCQLFKMILITSSLPVSTHTELYCVVTLHWENITRKRHSVWMFTSFSVRLYWFILMHNYKGFIFKSVTKHDSVSKISSLFDQTLWKYMERLGGLFCDDENWKWKIKMWLWKIKMWKSQSVISQASHYRVFIKYCKNLWIYKITPKIPSWQGKA